MKTSLSTKLITGCRRTVTVSDVVQMYRNVVSQSTPVSRRIQRLGDNMYSLTNYFTTVDCDTLQSVKTFKVYSLSTKRVDGLGNHIDSVRCISDNHEVGDVMSATSLNGRYLARIKSPASKHQLLEIWDRSKLIKTIDTANLDAHGAINVDSTFSNFVWSPSGDQDKLLYVCQPASPADKTFFEGGSRDANRGEKYIRKKDWGEGLVGIDHTMIGILDVGNECQISTINMEGSSLGTPQWLDDGKKIISVAYREEPKLELIWCNNKKSRLVIFDWPRNGIKPCIELESDLESFHTPRVNHQGNQFIYLSNPTYGIGEHAVKFNLYDLNTQTSKTLVDNKTNQDRFFIQSVPINCFTSDDKHILFAIIENTSSNMCLYSLESCKLTKIRYPTTGCSILDFRHDIIMGVGSEINATPTIFVSTLDLRDIDGVVGWHQIEDCIHLDEITYETFEIQTADKKSVISAILIEPDLKILNQNGDKSMQSNQLPTVVNPHGGPHCASIQKYMSHLLFYGKLGLKTLLINYRGSTGINEEFTQSLCGHISEYDVSDCLQAIRSLAEKKRIDPTKLILKGNSHGGFIAAHLSCNEEFSYTSAVIGNPVIDLPAMQAAARSPDWVYTEALNHEHYDPKHVPTTSELLSFYNCSPISVVSKCRTPTLMFLGKNDNCVHKSQGELWIDTLKANGCETLCKIYNDGHGLSRPETAADINIAAAIWILNHLIEHKE